MKHVGAPYPHESARGHVTGQARYVDDLWPRVAGVMHLWPVCVPHAHATVLDIDVARASSRPTYIGTPGGIG